MAEYNRTNMDVKINYTASDKLSVFGRYSFSPHLIIDPPALGEAGGDALNGGQLGSAPGRTQVAGLGGTVARGIKAVLDVCRRKAPDATIVLMGITPRNDNMAVMPIVNEVNERIARFADGKKVRYLNINDKLAGKDGRLLEGMANRDGLHLDVRGYQVWADALKPIFTELLGPPAKEDHAPPPIGDPSARKSPATPG